MPSFHVAGVPVLFPYEPYRAQLAVMHTAVSAVKDGKHAVIESPTGTGKTLALLCSSLAVQKYINERKYLTANKENVSVNVKELISPQYTATIERRRTSKFIDDDDSDFEQPNDFRDTFWQHFVPDLSSNSNSICSDHDCDEVGGDARREGPNVLHNLDENRATGVRIFYVSKTHSQISHLVSELRKTSYQPKITILGSRAEYCVNKAVRFSGRRDDLCRVFRNRGKCHFASGVNKLALLQTAGNEVWDIEEAVTLGKRHGGCPYYSSQKLYPRAELVFCPYNFVLDRRCRTARNIDVSNDIIIFDEAHNLDGMAREFSSAELDVRTATELAQDAIVMVDTLTLVTPFHKCLRNIAGMLHSFVTISERVLASESVHDTENGDEALVNGSVILKYMADVKISKSAVKDWERAVNYLCTHESGESVMLLQRNNDGTRRKSQKRKISEGESSHPLTRTHNSREVIRRLIGIAADIVNALLYLCRDPSCFTMSVSRVRTETHTGVTLLLLCMTSALCFRDVSDIARTVILASGTLKPVTAFCQELGTHFPFVKSVPHVVDVRKQLFVAFTGNGSSNTTLTATSRASGTDTFQNCLGETLIDYVRIIPHGVIVFLPSYSILEEMQRHWQESGTWWHLLNTKESVVVEPRKRGPQFDCVLKSYFEASKGNGGALLFAVFRGKLSEGVDFCDTSCRAVILIGIPLPFTQEVRIRCKMEWNNRMIRDQYRRVSQSGQDWYLNQGFKAVNQALGRVLRHRHDYGAVICLDRRYLDKHMQQRLPDWALRGVQVASDTHETLLGRLKDFFKAMSS
ncbi:DNA repair helicase (rad3) [Gracilaria domingensis]|nr:DNA repair helicase (rad3) [Gracilaria domingensis]